MRRAIKLDYIRWRIVVGVGSSTSGRSAIIFEDVPMQVSGFFMKAEPGMLLTESIREGQKRSLKLFVVSDTYELMPAPELFDAYSHHTLLQYVIRYFLRDWK